MLDNDLDLAALRVFRSVLRQGSFAAAALQLRLPKSTVSKRVADLEAALAVRLIERSTRQLRPTLEGEMLLHRAEALLAEADDIRRSLRDSGHLPRGHLRMAVTPVLGHVLMGRIATRFRAAYPEVTLEVHLTDQRGPSPEEGFDAVLRLGELADSSQMARLLLHGHAVLAAAPHLPGLDRLRAPADLAALPHVALTGPQDYWPLVNGSETVHIALRPGLTFGSQLALRDAVAEGAGVALLPRLLAAEGFQSGRLVPVLPGWTSPSHPLYITWPSSRSMTARLRVFIDHLVEALSALSR